MDKHYPTYGQSVILLLNIFLGGLVGALLIIPFFSLDTAIGRSLIYTIAMLATVALGLVIRRNRVLPASAFPWMIILISILTIVSAHIILEPLQALFPPPDFLIKMTRDVREHPYINFFTIVVAAPILEEILFRGIILDGFLKNYKPFNAILVSGFLFALIHGNLIQGIGALALGAFFGWIYWKTNSIAPSIILHAVNNCLGFMSVLYISEENLNKTFQEMLNNNTLYVIYYLVSIFAASVSVFLLHKKYLSLSPKESQLEIIPESKV